MWDVSTEKMRICLTKEKRIQNQKCIKRESNPRRVEYVSTDGNDPGYHYPINAYRKMVMSGIVVLILAIRLNRNYPKLINYKFDDMCYFHKLDACQNSSGMERTGCQCRIRD